MNRGQKSDFTTLYNVDLPTFASLRDLQGHGNNLVTQNCLSPFGLL